MNRRSVVLGTVPAVMLAVTEIRGGSAAVKVGTCGACKNAGSCSSGLECVGGVCGPADAECGGVFYTCDHRKLVCRQGSVATCYKKSARRKYVAARKLCG